MTGATPYSELNGLLDEITSTAREAFGGEFVGAYLQGSFAVGDADLDSDCDFIVVSRTRPQGPGETRVRALHAGIPVRPGHWNHHLEGSYVVAEELRSLDGLGREWLYVDHGADEMEWSTHCNTEVMRWSLRERGVVLDGPAPWTVIDPVPPDAIRERMRAELPALLDDLATWISIDRIAWGQRYAAATTARMLYSLHTGEVTSKKAALTWVGGQLPEYRELCEQVIADRLRGYDVHDVPRPGSVERTVALVHDAVRIATS
ncbi:MAG: aminoglycoside adenylyltransferase domain-containing protein [Nocardioidaceae bacterium]